EIAFQGISLLAVEVIETETDQRICDDTVRFHRLMTQLANPICAGVDSRQRRIDFVEQRVQASGVDGFGGGVFQALLANKQLLDHEVIYESRHSRHCRKLLVLRCSVMFTGYGTDWPGDTRFVLSFETWMVRSSSRLK